MIARLFKKSTPLNYSLVILGVVFFYFLYRIRHFAGAGTTGQSALLAVIPIVIFGSLFLTNFIIKRNTLSKDSAYTVLFYLLCMLFFPGVFNNAALVFSNFFMLLAMRRIVSLHSLKTPKEKIFDASVWVFVAAAFHFWAIMFIALVFISILFHAARDYRNWLLPFIAVAAIAIVFSLVALVFEPGLLVYLQNSATVDFKINYFTNNYQNGALSVYASIALFFVVSMIYSLSDRPIILHSSYKKIISAFFIGVAIFLVSPGKSNELLIFTFAPLAMMATAQIEMIKVKWQKDVIIYSFTLLAIFAFFSQL